MIRKKSRAEGAQPNRRSRRRASKDERLDVYIAGTRTLIALGVPILERLVSLQYKIRDVIPEPFDYPDHASNFLYSLGFGCVAGLIGAKAYQLLGKAPQSVTQARAAAGVLSLLVGAVANVVAETKLGAPIFADSSHGASRELTDFIYGLVAAVAAGTVLPGIGPARPDHERSPYLDQKFFRV